MFYVAHYLSKRLKFLNPNLNYILIKGFSIKGFPPFRTLLYFLFLLTKDLLEKCFKAEIDYKCLLNLQVEQKKVLVITNKKFINKIKANFIETQQQLFIASLYSYLHHNQNTEFIIDLDDVWKWLGFTNKANAKKLLEKCFKI